MVLIIKRLISVLLAAALLLWKPPAVFADNAPQIAAERAVVMGAGGEILYAKRAEERAAIASTTKIMTAILTLERGKLDDTVVPTAEYCAVEGSSMYLIAGERYTVRELLQGLLLASGNDAALTLASYVAGDVSSFVAQMNEKALSLGLLNTHFENPHGLDGEKHYSTAADLACLMAYCMENESFAQLIGMKGCTVRGMTYVNHNKLLTRCVGCTGGKTGFTARAGRCLVSCCERGGTRLICVTLNDPQDWEDHQQLYDWAFSQYSQQDLGSGLHFAVPVISGASAQVHVSAEPLRVLLREGQEAVVELELPRFVFAPVVAGEVAGKARVTVDDRLLGEARLLYEETVPESGGFHFLRDRLWNRT